MDVTLNPVQILLGLVGTLATVASAMAVHAFREFGRKLDALTSAQALSDNRVQALEHERKRDREVLELQGKKLESLATALALADSRALVLEHEIGGLRDWRHGLANEVQRANLLEIVARRKAGADGDGS